MYICSSVPLFPILAHNNNASTYLREYHNADMRYIDDTFIYVFLYPFQTLRLCGDVSVDAIPSSFYRYIRLHSDTMQLPSSLLWRQTGESPEMALTSAFRWTLQLVWTIFSTETHEESCPVNINYSTKIYIMKKTYSIKTSIIKSNYTLKSITTKYPNFSLHKLLGRK